MTKFKMINKLCSLTLSLCMILSNAAALAADETEIAPPSENQLQDIINDDFTELDEKNDEEVRETYSETDDTIIEDTTAEMNFSDDGEFANNAIFQAENAEVGTNLALNKTVTGSSEAYSDSFGFEMVTDGNQSTRLALKDWVNLSNAWIKIDLGKIYQFNQINIIEFRKRLKKFKLQYSVDNSSWTDIGEYETDANNEAVDPFRHDPYKFNTVEGRYVRILIEENVKIETSHYLGISLYEVEVLYTGENILSYDPNAAAGEEGSMSSTDVKDYGISFPSTSWSCKIVDVNTALDGVSGKKGIMFSPRLSTESVLRETGRMVFADDKINNPSAMNNIENGYVFEQEFASYIRPNLVGDALWQYRLMGKDTSGNDVVIANVETKLTKTDAGLPQPQNNIVYGEARIADAENSAVLPFPLQSEGKASAPHISFLRVYVDLKNQTYTVWLVTRGDINTPYTEKEPEKAQLLISDEPFSSAVNELTGFQVWSQNTYGDQTSFTRINVRGMEAERVVDVAANELEVEDILGENASSAEITSALELPQIYRSAEVSWSAFPSGIIGEDGGVISAPNQSTDVTLTATFSRDGASAEKQFTVTVTPAAVVESDERKVEIETEALSLGDLSAVTRNLTLNTVGAARGCEIRWASDKPEIINTDGTVTRPLRDATVTLTATITKGDASQTKIFTATVKGTQTSRVIAGIEGSYFSGGTFYETDSLQFADLFEGDGSNGTNGTVLWEANGKEEGLKAQKTAEGIRFSRAGTGANPGRAQAMLDKTYDLPELEDLNTPYYMELNFKIATGGAVNFDFGQNEGTDEEPAGTTDVVRVRKLDDYTGTDSVAGTIEGPAAYAFKLNDISKVQASYSAGEDVSLGLYVIPSLKEMIFYKNGKVVSGTIYEYSNPESALETLRVTWYQSIRWYSIPESEYLLLKNFKVYQGPGIPDNERLNLDAEALTFSAISNERETQVTENVTLNTTGKFGSSIAWTSSNPEIIDPATGIVARQKTTEKVTLTAVLSLGGASVEKTFTITVLQKGTDGNILKGKKVSISGTTSIEELANFTDGIFDTYIETMDKGVKPQITVDIGENKQFSKVVLYEGADNGVYSIKSGVLEVSTDQRTWTEVGKIGTIGANYSISFTPVEARYIRFSVTGLDKDQTVRLCEMEAVLDASDTDIVKADMKDLKAFDSRNVTESTTFATKGKFGSNISWTSKNTNVVDNTGKVTRPSGSGQEVVIVATVSYGAASDTVSFNHYILGTGGNTGGGSSGGSGGGSKAQASGSGTIVQIDKNKTDNGDNPDDTNKSENPFEDVNTDDWAYGYIKELYTEGIVKGNEKGLFDPKRSITREEFLKLLLLAIDVEIVSDGETVFSDVNADDWFADYINTAYKLGLVSGISDTTFGVGQNITRQDMAVMVKRAADYKGMILQKKSDNDLTDIDTVSDYAKESVTALANAAIISGDESAAFNPLGSTLREQAAAIISRLRAEE